MQRCPVCNLDMGDVQVTTVTEVGQFEFSNGLIINWLNNKKIPWARYVTWIFKPAEKWPRLKQADRNKVRKVPSTSRKTRVEPRGSDRPSMHPGPNLVRVTSGRWALQAELQKTHTPGK